MDIHGSFIVYVYTHNKDHVIPGLGSSRIQCIHGHPQIIHCTCVHTTTRTMLSQGWVVREYNVSMDIHGSFIVCVYTHNKDHVVPGLGSSRIQCIHGHPQIIHCTCVHTQQQGRRQLLQIGGAHERRSPVAHAQCTRIRATCALRIFRGENYRG